MKFDFNKNINEDVNINRLISDAKLFIRTGLHSRFKKLLLENPNIIPYITDFLKSWNLSLEDFIPSLPSNGGFTFMPTDLDNDETVEEPIDNDDSNNEIIDDEPQNIEHLHKPKKLVPTDKIGRFAYSIDSDNIAFKNALIEIADAHSKILDLYDYTLYEDNWTETTVNQFEELLLKYNENLLLLRSMLPSMEWHSPSIKLEFMQIYRDLIKADADAWNRVYARHNNYLRYRTNRRSIISQIADIIGGVKNTKDANYQDIFKYFNNKCADIKLYDNSNKAEKQDVLSKWLKPHLNEVMDEMKDRGIFSGAIDSVDIFKVFRIYVKCRKLAYAIFNLMTSNSEFNGYAKWHNRFIDYCDATLNDRQLELLINAVDSENQFETVDDYQNTMDEESWESKGIFESWFDDELEYYRNNKDRFNKSKIHKINMVPDNANVCKITCDGTYVYASTNFYPGDIIEICPTKMLGHDSLYSRDVRDVVFEIPGKKYVIPFGYCRFYLHDVPFDQCNCTYIWDPVKRVIVIKAINKIQKNSRLLLQTEMQ